MYFSRNLQVYATYTVVSFTHLNFRPIKDQCGIASSWMVSTGSAAGFVAAEQNIAPARNAQNLYFRFWLHFQKI